MTLSVPPNLIDAQLPQTQCTRCGYPRCLEYAEAVGRGEADINQCPPGGEVTIANLATLLNRAPKPLNPVNGEHQPRLLAFIEEPICIGCRKCIDVCPVDAILGARKLMHTVIITECTGCELCVPVCPVDCIELLPVCPTAPGERWPEYAEAETARWRQRTERHFERHIGRRKARVELKPRPAPTPETSPAPEKIREEIRAAVQRVKTKRDTKHKST
jgi:electron transport complex protein RnfB